MGRGEVRPGQPPRGRGHGRGVRGSGGRGGGPERPTGAQMRHKFGNGVNGGDKTNKVRQGERWWGTQLITTRVHQKAALAPADLKDPGNSTDNESLVQQPGYNKLKMR